MRFVKFLAPFLALSCLFGCTLMPNYKTPDSPVQLEKKEEVKRISWEEFFETPELKELVKRALNSNRDLRMAYLNIEVARGNYKVQNASFLPHATAAASRTYVSDQEFQEFGFPSRTFYQAMFNLNAYEVDLFGRLRSLSKAAQENMLSTTANANAVRMALISQIASSYANYLAIRENENLLKQNAKLYEKKLEIVKLSEKQGLVSKEAIYQAQNMLRNYESSLNKNKALLETEKTNLNLLAGENIEDILCITNVTAIKVYEEKLDFIPSEVLLQRASIRKAEHDLKAANANIGAVRAAFFPSISITGFFGFASKSFSSVLDNNGWSYKPMIAVPIFNGGANVANLTISKKQKEIAIANYEKAIQTAFKEARDALSQRELAFLERKKGEEDLLDTQKIFDIKIAQFEEGLISKLDLIESEIALNLSKVAKNSVERDYSASIVEVFRALGQGF